MLHVAPSWLVNEPSWCILYMWRRWLWYECAHETVRRFFVWLQRIHLPFKKFLNNQTPPINLTNTNHVAHTTNISCVTTFIISRTLDQYFIFLFACHLTIYEFTKTSYTSIIGKCTVELGPTSHGVTIRGKGFKSFFIPPIPQCGPHHVGQCQDPWKGRILAVPIEIWTSFILIDWEVVQLLGSCPLCFS